MFDTFLHGRFVLTELLIFTDTCGTPSNSRAFW